MSNVFLSILNISITASWLVLAVVVLRLALKKAPKWITCLLWLVVALRLVMPFSLESIFSLVPSAQTLPPEIMMDKTPEIQSGIPIVNEVINPIISQSFAPQPSDSANPLQIIIPIAAQLWIVGIIAMLIYALVSYLNLKRKVKICQKHSDNIYFCDYIASPFILGIIKPRIYLPSGISDKEMNFVIEHEKAHLKRKDHLIKPFAFVLLTLYWFNPVIWLAYILLCRDIELACDQKAIKDMDADEKVGYSEALVSLSTQRRMIMVCPVAFGEVGVKDRIKSVLNYKKPAFWVIIASLVVCAAVALCFLTNPKEKQPVESSSSVSSQENTSSITSSESAESESLNTLTSSQTQSNNISSQQSGYSPEELSLENQKMAAELIEFVKNNSASEIEFFDGSKNHLASTNFSPYQSTAGIEPFEKIQGKAEVKKFIKSLELDRWQPRRFDILSVPFICFYIGEDVQLKLEAQIEIQNKKYSWISISTAEHEIFYVVPDSVYDMLWDFYDTTEMLPSGQESKAWDAVRNIGYNEHETVSFYCEKTVPLTADFTPLDKLNSIAPPDKLIEGKEKVREFVDLLGFDQWKPRVFPEFKSLPKAFIYVDENTYISLEAQTDEHSWVSVNTVDEKWYYVVPIEVYNRILDYVR
ncbi:MAG: hypothetical protein E7539_04740 [Ruminococcaceae bacterium]|nr:hypothetical protein [Oscillospiraceae bacterium]